MIRPPACDGCFEDIDQSLGYIGMDVYEAPDDVDEDDDDPVNDEQYTHHFCRTECVWAWSMRQVAEVT
jgi:hypothetical protein